LGKKGKNTCQNSPKNKLTSLPKTAQTRGTSILCHKLNSGAYAFANQKNTSNNEVYQGVFL
jgi:hypothetical protein